jgi:hypothetical protein
MALPDRDKIERACFDVFMGTDERNWDRVKSAFASQVLLDYSSMSGQPAVIMTPQQIVTAWQGMLPGFDYTHHQLGNVLVTIRGADAELFCYGTATHYIADQPNGTVWTVVGTYYFHLVCHEETWQIDHMKFDFKYQDGNLELPVLATERA